jgi:phosphopantetheinyl transferase
MPSSENSRKPISETAVEFDVAEVNVRMNDCPQRETIPVFKRYATRKELRSAFVRPEQQWLCDAERAELERFRDHDRRESWVWGRVLAKQAIIQHCPGVAEDPVALNICSRDAQGRAVRPIVEFTGTPQSWCLSIAHSDRSVFVAIATEPGASVGVDLTQHGKYGTGFLKTWFTKREQRFLASAGDGEIATCWSIKEAVYKAVNNGEPFVPRRVEVHKEARGIYGCRYRNIDLTGNFGLDVQVLSADGHSIVTATLPTSVMQTMLGFSGDDNWSRRKRAGESRTRHTCNRGI